VAGALYKQCAELGKWIRAKFVRKVLIDASALSISDWQRRQILYRLDQTQRRSVNRQYRYVRGASMYLLVRNAARFIITLQQSVEQSTTRASCLSFDEMTPNTCDASGSSARRPQPVPLDRRFNGQWIDVGGRRGG
jgi:hypothetical protein